MIKKLFKILSTFKKLKYSVFVITYIETAMFKHK